MKANKLLLIIFLILTTILLGEGAYYIFVSTSSKPSPPKESIIMEKTSTSWENWQLKYKHLIGSQIVSYGKFKRLDYIGRENNEYHLILENNGDDFYIYYFKDKSSKIAFYNKKNESIKETSLKEGDLLMITEIYNKNPKNGIEYDLTVKQTDNLL